MGKEIDVSVIVPIFNVENYLNRSIKSILNQTFKNFEVILINDGSIDKSLSICEEYYKKDKRIKIINQVNQGVSTSRNIGIEISKGKFIMFIDPDDELEEDAIEYLYNLINRYNADIACYRMKTYKNNILKSNINIDENIKVYCNDEIIREQVNKATFLHSSCNKLYSRKVINNIRFNINIKYAEDSLFNFKVLSNSSTVVASNLQKYNYYINQSSTVNNFDNRRIDILKAQFEIYELLQSKYNNYMENMTRDIIYSSVSILIDMVRSNQYDKEMLLRLKQIIKDNNSKLKDRSLVETKTEVLFNILTINPKLIWILYSIRFSIRRYLKGKG